MTTVFIGRLANLLRLLLYRRFDLRTFDTMTFQNTHTKISLLNLLSGVKIQNVLTVWAYFQHV